jgi:hypothetical protein
VRITVGTTQHTNRLLVALREVVADLTLDTEVKA